MKGRGRDSIWLIGHMFHRIMLVAALLGVGEGFCQCIPVTQNGFQENLLQATFHTVLYKSQNGYAASGYASSPLGQAQSQIEEISFENGYTGISSGVELVWGTLGGSAQFIFVGDDDVIYAGGVQGNVLNPVLTMPNGSAFAAIPFGLPSGVGHGSIRKFQATNEALMLLTDGGDLYITGNVCGNVMSPCNTSTWNLVTMPPGVLPILVDLNPRTLFMYGSNGQFYTRGTRTIRGDAGNWSSSTGAWTLMISPPLSSGSEPVQIEMGSLQNLNQVTYLVLDADGTIHSLGNAPITGNGDINSLTWAKVGQSCTEGVLNDVIFITANDNDSRTVAAGALLSDGTIRLWGMDDSNMLGGAQSECPSIPCMSVGTEMNQMLYLENGTHLTPAIGEEGLLCNVGHNDSGGFGDGTEDDRDCYECVSLPMDDLCINGGCALDTLVQVTICSGHSHEEGSSIYTETGTYVDIYTSSQGCDSTVTTQLIVDQGGGLTNEITICNGSSYVEGTSVYTTTGTYQDVYSSSSGCDSIVTTILDVMEGFEQTNEVTICDGASYIEGSSVYTNAGTYIDSYSNSSGCDSTVTTILEMIEEIVVVNEVTICYGDTYTEGNSVYTTEGAYQDIYQSMQGCDSVVTTVLSVLSSVNIVNEVSLCDGETYVEGDSEYTSSGEYTDVYISSLGCDSVVTTVLNVIPSIIQVNDVEICEGTPYIVGNSEYTENGSYIDTLQSESGCDSTVTTNLTVSPFLNVTNVVSICQGESHTEGHSAYNETGVYTDVYQTISGCDSIVTTDLTVNPTPLIELPTEPIEGCEEVQVVVQNLAENDDLLSYHWTTYDGQSSISPEAEFTFSQIGTHHINLELESSEGCVSTNDLPLEIWVHPGPVASFDAEKWTTDLTEPVLEFSAISSTDIDSWLWDFGEGSSAQGPSVSHTYSTDGVFQVQLTVMSEWGCSDSTRSPVTVHPVNLIQIPNAFTPDPLGPSDGSYVLSSLKNHIFFAHAKRVTHFEMHIFNRWGEQMFKSEDILLGWDGYFNGSLCAQDVYSYSFRIGFEDGSEQEVSGVVNLLR